MNERKWTLMEIEKAWDKAWSKTGIRSPSWPEFSDSLSGSSAAEVNDIPKYHGRSEYLNGEIVWAIYSGGKEIGFAPNRVVAYFMKHSDATKFIKNNSN